MSSEGFEQFSHRQRQINAPASREHLDRMLGLLAAAQPARIVDFGCGTGAWLLSLLERIEGAQGTGIDSDALALQEARARALARGLDARVEWREQQALAHVEAAPAAYDCALCVGSSHAFGGYRQALVALRDVVSNGAVVLVGEGQWDSEPPAPYLEFLGGDEDLGSHQQKVELAESHGFRVVWATSASLGEWDEFEWEFYRVAADYAARHSDASELLAKRTAWRDAYLRWGRGTMGFGYFMLRAT